MLSKSIIIALGLFVLLKQGNAGISQRYDYYDPHQEEIHESDEDHLSDKGYSIGSGLRSIADHSASQANSAVQNQHVAAVQAAYLAKNTLAQSAVQAASTALTALAGKEVLLKNLHQQLDDAHKSLESELLFLQITKKAAAASKQVHIQAEHQTSLAAASLNSAQTLTEHAEIALKESLSQLAIQSEMVGKAKTRLEQAEKKLDSVQIDFEATKSAADKAQLSAQEAKNNAASAGKHVSIGYSHESNESGTYGSELSHDHHYRN